MNGRQAGKSLLLGAVLIGCGDGAAPCEGDACAAVEVPCPDGECLGTARWSQSLPINIHGAPALDAATGHVFVTSGVVEDQLIKPVFDAFGPDGTPLWHEELMSAGYEAWPTRPVLVDDSLFVAVGDRLFKYGKDGKIDYHAIAPDGSEDGVNYAFVAPPPAVGLSDRIYWQYLAASNPDGSLAWRTFLNPETRCQTPMAVRPNRVLAWVDDTITAYDQNGDPAWTVSSPNDLRGDAGCVMVPVSENVVATAWCEKGYSAFVCGHVVTLDVVTGDVLSVTAPPKPVASTSTLLIDESGDFILFSVGPTGNPEYKSRMWRVAAEGGVIDDVVTLPYFGVYGASLGDDGLLYVATNLGAAAMTRTGEIQWKYERPETAGHHAGPPALGANGCVYYESVRQFGRNDFERELVCLVSGASGLADTVWPRTIGGNDSALRPPQ